MLTGAWAEIAGICAVSAGFIESDWRADHQARFDGKVATAGGAQIFGLSACDLSRRVCAKLFPIWTVVIDHFPAQLLVAKALVSRGFPSPFGA